MSNVQWFTPETLAIIFTAGFGFLSTTVGVVGKLIVNKQREANIEQKRSNKVTELQAERAKEISLLRAEKDSTFDDELFSALKLVDSTAEALQTGCTNGPLTKARTDFQQNMTKAKEADKKYKQKMQVIYTEFEEKLDQINKE